MQGWYNFADGDVENRHRLNRVLSADDLGTLEPCSYN